MWGRFVAPAKLGPQHVGCSDDGRRFGRAIRVDPGVCFPELGGTGSVQLTGRITGRADRLLSLVRPARDGS